MCQARAASRSTASGDLACGSFRSRGSPNCSSVPSLPCLRRRGKCPRAAATASRKRVGNGRYGNRCWRVCGCAEGGLPVTRAAMRISVSDPDRIPELLSFLRERPDVVAELVDGTQIAVSLLGSRAVDENVNELEQRLQPWRAANGGVQRRAARVAVASAAIRSRSVDSLDTRAGRRRRDPTLDWLGGESCDSVRLHGVRVLGRTLVRQVPGVRNLRHARRGEAARGQQGREPLRVRCSAWPTWRSRRRRGSRPASPSSTACSAAGSCRRRSSCSAASPASASRRSS